MLRRVIQTRTLRMSTTRLWRRRLAFTRPPRAPVILDAYGGEVVDFLRREEFIFT